MRIKIDGNEREYELRALAVLFGLLADGRAAHINSIYNPLKLTDGDATPGFKVAEAVNARVDSENVGTVAFDQKTPADQPAATEPTKRSRRTRAQIAADNATAALAVVDQQQAATAAPDGPSVPATHASTPELPAAPLAPAVPTALSVPIASAPDASVTTPTPPIPTTANVPTVSVPQSFPELMRAVSPALASKKLTADALNAACAQVGTTNLQGLLQNQALVPAVWELVRGAL